MQLSAILTFLVFGVNTIAMALTPRQQNTCFDMNKGSCVGRQADTNNATIAITNACNKVTSCVPGQTGHGRSRVTGKHPSTLCSSRKAGIVKGFPYTATLYVGDWCGGASTWSTQSCVDLFNSFVDARCEQQWPSGDNLFQLGYQTAPCDSSFVSFNLGG